MIKTKKIKLIYFFAYIMIITLLFINLTEVKADNNKKQINYEEYTEEYKQWLKLSEEEQKHCIAPDMYAVPESTYTPSNPLKLSRTSKIKYEYDFFLHDYIPENMVIKNQESTSMCWGFASIGVLETNLALRDYYNKVSTKVYDFSERHLNYSLASQSIETNGAVDPDLHKRLNRSADTGGSFSYAISYFTNGLGAVDESSMPFENNSDPVDISELQNKKVQTQVFDTIDFSSHNASTVTTEFMDKIKSHIINYGGIYASINGNTGKSEYYNKEHAAFYCNKNSSCPTNHGVLIVGWSDNYSASNFNEKHQPQNDGAWIIRNSYGSLIEYEPDALTARALNMFCRVEKNGCTIDNLWKNISEREVYTEIIADEEFYYVIDDNNQKLYKVTDTSGIEYYISNETVIQFIEESSYSYDEEKNVYYKIQGDNGYYYISYEDDNIYRNLHGIINSTDHLNYDNIYQYNYLSFNYQKYFNTSDKLYVANKFSRNDISTKEFINQVSIEIAETNYAKVYVNPNGSSISKEDLQEVKLKYGDEDNRETLEAGYHTLEFLNPIELTGEDFAVVVELDGTKSNTILLRLEGYQSSIDKHIETETGKCFYSTDLENWNDFSNIKWTNSVIGADSTIKAFTITEIENIEITTKPSKTTYIEGDDFDATGMVVSAVYKDGSKFNITDYSIEEYTNLQLGTDSITIKYLNKTAQVSITVEENTLEKLIVDGTFKTSYIESESFDNTGMIVKAIYKNGNEIEVSDYQIENGTDLKTGQTSVTITYNGVNISLAITVRERNITKIEVEQEPIKMTYNEGEDFDSNGMKIKVTYEIGDSSVIEEGYEIVNGDKLEKGIQNITISYKGKTTILKVEVIEIIVEKILESIRIEKEPLKTEYIEGENFDSNGMKVVAIYSDNTEEEVLSYNVVNGTKLQKGQTELIISYEGKTTKQQITVKEKEIDTLEIKTKPNKEEYIQNNEELDLTGGIIKIKYNNSEELEINMTSDEIEVTGFDNTKVGEQEISLTYQGKTVKITITVKKEEKAVNSNFEKAEGILEKIKAYYYVEKNDDDYVVLETKVTGIEKNDENDELEYYYYLSSVQEIEYIQDWVKIAEEQDVKEESIKFDINTNEISNYEEVSSSDVLYLYIKEVAKKGSKQSTVITKAMKIESNVEVEEYIDNVKVENNHNNDQIPESPPTGNWLLNVVFIIGIISLIYTRYYSIKLRNAN